MPVIGLGARLTARRRAERLLLEGRRHVVGLDLERAEPELRRALELARESRSRLVLISVAEELYQVLLRRRRLDEAVPVLDELVACHAHHEGPDAERTASWRNELIRVLGQLGRFAEADPHCQERLAAASRRQPRDQRALGLALVTLAWCVRSQGRRDEAERLCRQAIDVFDDPGSRRGSAGWALVGLAAVLVRRMAVDEAEAALRRAASEWAAVGRAELGGRGRGAAHGPVRGRRAQPGRAGAVRGVARPGQAGCGGRRRSRATAARAGPARLPPARGRTGRRRRPLRDPRRLPASGAGRRAAAGRRQLDRPDWPRLRGGAAA